MRIVIVEDHAMFRQIIRKGCEDDLGHAVVGETGSGRAAVDLILKESPDAVLLDLVLPDLDGFAIVKQVRDINPFIRFVALSAYADDYTLYRVERAGMRGYIDKGTDTIEVLRRALRTLEEGGLFYSKKYQDAKLHRQMDSHFSKMLSDWECTILCLIGRGWTDLEIAAHLNLSALTVQSHRSHIMRKLDLKGTPKLIAFAIEHGFVHFLPEKLPSS